MLRLINTSLEEIWLEEYILHAGNMLAVEFLIWHVTFKSTWMCFYKEQTHQDIISEKAIELFLFHNPPL